MTEDRIDYLIKDSGAGSRKDYAQKWITSISPSDFLAMTLRRPSQVRETFDNMPSEYGSTVNNYDYIRALKDEMRQTPYLAVDVNTGKVVGHEGRHRMRALEKEGITNAEMVIEFRDKNGNLVKEKNGYGNPLEILDSLTIKNQYGTRQSATVQNVIPLNEANRENIIASYGNEDAQIRYSERNTGTGIASNRELLAGALESAAQTDIEKSMLERYQKNTKLMDNEQKRLDGIRAQIRELSFAKGPRQTDKINELRQTAKQIESKINAYDKKLLNLEAASPLKAVLERERNIITIIIVFSPPLIIQDLKTLDERNVI